jgi:SLOG family YspA-like protein
MAGRILICGDREWTDFRSISAIIQELIHQYGEDISIIHGAARGADSLAGRAALDLQLVTVAVPAKWDRDGKRAGPIRNRFMLEKCKPHLVLAFHSDLENSKGTKHMVMIAKDAGVPVLHIKNHTEVELIYNELPESLCTPVADG